MSAPQIFSTTVGISLPSFTIAKELSADAEPAGLVLGRAGSKVVKPATRAAAGRGKLALRFAPALLLALNVILFGSYLVNVNSLQGLSYTVLQQQRSLAQLQDKQRQYQVRIAESSAALRAREADSVAGKFVALGAPEFVTKTTPSVVSMK